MSNFMKIRRVGAELLYADRQADIYDEANRRFFVIFRTRLKKTRQR